MVNLMPEKHRFLKFNIIENEKIKDTIPPTASLMLYAAVSRLWKAFLHLIAQENSYTCHALPQIYNNQFLLIMKKTLITLLALAGVAAAGTTTFSDLSQDKTITLSDGNSITWSATEGTFTGSIYTAVSSQQARASVSFTLNLTAAETVGSTKTELVTIIKDDYEHIMGLWLVDGKISGRWDDGTYDQVSGTNNPGTASGQVSITSIIDNNENIFTVGEDKFIALTLVLD